METHTALSLLDKQDRNAVSREQKKRQTFPTFRQLAICNSLRPRPSDILNVQPGKDWTSGWLRPRRQHESYDFQERILAGHYRTRRDTIKHSGQFSRATRRPLKDFQLLQKKASSTHRNGWSPTPTRRNNLNQGCVKAVSLLELVPTSGSQIHGRKKKQINSNFF